MYWSEGRVVLGRTSYLCDYLPSAQQKEARRSSAALAASWGRQQKSRCTFRDPARPHLCVCQRCAPVLRAPPTCRCALVCEGVRSCPLGSTVLYEPVSVDIHLHPMTCAETYSSAAEVLGRGVATAVYWSEGRVGLGRTPLPPAYLPHAQGARGCSNTAPRRYLGSGCSSLGVHFIGPPTRTSYWLGGVVR